MTPCPRSLSFAILFAGAALTARANDADLDHPPYDFSDAYYVANGIDPTTLIGRPNGTPPGSIIDETPNGPNFNNVRLLELTAAFDHSGHPIFFYVTGLPTPASFLANDAGDEAFEIAEKYKVYEFPRAANAPLAVFPKRQDLIADLSNGYFSNNPLGVWQVNLVRYTPAATNTAAGQAALAQLAATNGVDLDGTPVVRTKSEVESLQSKGFVTVQVPPVGVGRWFFCPVLKDPKGGEIAPDAHLTFVELANGQPLPAEQAHVDLFHCIQSTDDDCQAADTGSSTVRVGSPANPIALAANGAPILGTTWELTIQHTTFVPQATADVLWLGAQPQNVAAGNPGTLLVPPTLLFAATPGVTFLLPVPLATFLIGVNVSAQGASSDASSALHLTNALDAEIGTH